MVCDRRGVTAYLKPVQKSSMLQGLVKDSSPRLMQTIQQTIALAFTVDSDSRIMPHLFWVSGKSLERQKQKHSCCTLGDNGLALYAISSALHHCFYYWVSFWSWTRKFAAVPMLPVSNLKTGLHQCSIFRQEKRQILLSPELQLSQTILKAQDLFQQCWMSWPSHQK